MRNIKLENLEINGYQIYQDKDSFNFGIDAVLLANFALREYSNVKNINNDIKICDLCTGTLPIPLIMYAKRNKFLIDENSNSKISIDSFEIDKDQVSLCNKSILWNNENVDDAKNILNDIKVFNDDIKNIFLDREKYKKFYESYDMITVNPPYNKKGSGIINLNDKKVVARHEVSITFDEICKVANLLLKSNKKFYLINHSTRFDEICNTLNKYSFAVKKVEFVHQNIDKQSNLVLIESVKNGNTGMVVLPPIIIFNEDGTYTDKVLNYYGK